MSKPRDSGQWTVDSGQWTVDSGQWIRGSAIPGSQLLLSVFWKKYLLEEEVVASIDINIYFNKRKQSEKHEHEHEENYKHD